MRLAAPIALVGWVPAAAALFRLVPPRRAVVAGFVAGWLFLPVITYRLAGLPDYDKMTATVLGVLAGVLLFDRGRLRALRPRLVDLPMVAWCLCPLASSISNGLGVYDGASAVLAQVVAWGLPYAAGRVYLADAAALADLALGVVLGGLVYVPLCLLEIVAGPHLHALVYGSYPQALLQTMRLGGWRPPVFMRHGLMVALWMTAASLIALWLGASGARARLGGIPMRWWGAVLVVTTVWLKSVNGWVLLGLGGALLWLTWRGRARWALLAVLLAVPGYVGLRAGGAWSGHALVAVTQATAGADRATSVAFRLHNEDLLAARARRRPLFGWGRWDRARVLDTATAALTVVDSLWIKAFGESGTVGVTSLLATLLLPVGVFWHRYALASWREPALAPAAVLAIVLVLYAVDGSLNAMVNPVYMLAGGGLAGLATAAR
jgi:hypothetical protein